MKLYKPNLIIQCLVIVLCCLAVSSCVSFKNVPYFQDVNRDQVTTQDIKNYSDAIIHPLDELMITVSSKNPETITVFNNNTQAISTSPLVPVYQYLVDKEGQITLPLIGSFQVSGLTTTQLTNQIKQKLVNFLTDARVTVRLLNFKVAVLGDVARPSVYTSLSERLTITEALSMAGDLNITADRDKIVLVREVGGKRQFYPVDLKSIKLFESPYFYLKPNDLIFVPPTKLKLASLDNPFYRNMGLIISALSVIATFGYLALHK